MAIYGINLDATERPLDGRHLDRLIDRWLEAVSVEVEPVTLAGYKQKIAHFRRWWDETGPSLDWKITRSSLAAFGRWLAEQPSVKPPHNPPSYGQQEDVLRRVAQMFKWARARGYTEIDHGEWLPAPIGEPKVRKAPTLEDLAKLMKGADTAGDPVRDRAILAFLIGTGARRAEVATLRIEDIQFAADGSGTATVRGKRTKANKSGRHTVAFDRATGAYLIAYIDQQKRESGPLFASECGKEISTQTIYRVVKRAIRRAKLKGGINATHDLRRAFATHLARYAHSDPAIAGDLIRRQLGQASYRTTAEHYTLLEADDIREAIVSPLSMMAVSQPERG